MGEDRDLHKTYKNNIKRRKQKYNIVTKIREGGRAKKAFFIKI